MGLCGMLGDQHIRRNGKHNAVGTLSLAELCELDAGLGGQRSCTEENGNDLQAAGSAVLHVSDDRPDDQLLLLERQQRDLTCRAENEQLAGAVLDLTGDQQLEAFDIDLIVLGKRSRHCDPGTLEIHHDKFLAFNL